MKRIFPRTFLLLLASTGALLAAESAAPPALPPTSAPPLPPPISSAVPPLVKPADSKPSVPGQVPPSAPTAPAASTNVPPPPLPEAGEGPLTKAAGDAVMGDPPAGPQISLGMLQEMQKVLQDNIALRQKLDQMQGAAKPSGPAIEVTSADSKDSQRKSLMAELREQYKGTNVDVYSQGEYVVVRIPEATYQMGEVKMPVSIKTRLKPVADASVKYAASFDLIVEGHSDASPVKAKSKSNWTVAFSRAEAVAKELESLKVPIRSMAISSRGQGLLALPDDPFSSVNRRVELVFGPKRSLEPLPKAATAGTAATAAKKPAPKPVVPAPVVLAKAPAPQVPATNVVPSLPQAPTKVQVAPAQPNEVVAEVTNIAGGGQRAPEDAEDVMIDLPVMVLNAPPSESSAPSLEPARP